MTLEDFIESVVAGWVPVAWHPAAHYAAIVWRWLLVHVAPWAALLAVRGRK